VLALREQARATLDCRNHDPEAASAKLDEIIAAA
jgi:hypothetical protein